MSRTSERHGLHSTFARVANQTYCGREATHRLNILIVGCGIGGLSAAHCLSRAGHNITVIESACSFSEVGAGIQLSPNASLLLIRWGLGDKLRELGVKPEGFRFRRYKDGMVVGYRYIGDLISRTYGAPYYNIHRADLHSMLLTLVASSPRVTIRFNSTVAKVDANPHPQVSITLTSGEVLSGEMIVGADGLKSILRNVVVGRPDHAEPTGDAAYRAVIKTDVLEMDKDLKALVASPEINVWMGPAKHVVGYFIRAKQEYNLVMLHPDDGSMESWTAEGSAERMREDFKDFEPRVRKLLSCVNTTLKWRLMDRKPLETWVHPEGRLVLLGDSCHPMLPYRAQGAAMAIEDAAVLGSLLSRLSSLSDLSRLLHAYECLRKGRTTETQASSRDNRRIFHLPDGPDQRARDASMYKSMRLELQWMHEPRTEQSGSKTNIKAGVQKSGGKNNPMDEQYSYDADKEVERWWAKENDPIMYLTSKL